jgi:hypothetical protein
MFSAVDVLFQIAPKFHNLMIAIVILRSDVGIGLTYQKKD